MNPKRIYRLLAKLMFNHHFNKEKYLFKNRDEIQTIALFLQKIETYPKDHKLLIDK